MKAVVAVFNQEKVLEGAFSVIMKTNCDTDGSSAALMKVVSCLVSLAGWLCLALAPHLSLLLLGRLLCGLGGAMPASTTPLLVAQYR